ncbi:hypothetical protein [Streptomyces sp. NPDC002132]|uniref:hypothetical protein n=1 Tax=unclassified Streptomyces TaxID=2593676 RepID=UPI00331CD8EC
MTVEWERIGQPGFDRIVEAVVHRVYDGVDDVSARVRPLGGQADGLDDHWTIDSGRQGDTVVHTLRGKHLRAHEVSPVVFTLTGIGPLVLQ